MNGFILMAALSVFLISGGMNAAGAASDGKGGPLLKNNVLKIDEKDISITHMYAQLRDNAEGLLDSPTELRILLLDREAPQGALDGISFLPVMDMAREGKVHGLLIRMNPADRKQAFVTLLYPPKSPDASLSTQTRSSSKGDVIKNLKIAKDSVSGEIEKQGAKETFFEDMPNPSYKIVFNAPVVPATPVTADLKGKDAQDSPQVAILRKKADAMARGDIAAIKAVCTERANRMAEAFAVQAGPDAFKQMMKQYGEEMKKEIREIKRLVVRGDRAVALLPDNASVNFVKEGTEWKSDN